MAILIEEEKKKINWFALLGILIVVGILASTVYYLFFINPSSIEIIIPHRLKTLEQVDQIKFNPAEILDNPVLKSLAPKVAPIIPEPAFNSNPFQ
jgi:hypothetical protein